ncbi:MAG: hypothetical protein V4496_04895 [Pseudomonadota bacterium]
MHSNIEPEKSTGNQWRWFIGLYAASLIGYGLIELGIHYLNAALLYL